MKRKIFPLLFLFFATSLYSDSSQGVFRIYAEDTSGVKHIIEDGKITSQGGFSLFGGQKEEEKFLSFQYGMAEVTIPFERIKEVLVTERDKKYATIQVLLKNGKKITGKIKSKTKIQGKGSFASSYSISFLYLKRIKFEAREGFLACSKCKRKYFEKNWKFCPYDGASLK